MPDREGVQDLMTAHELAAHMRTGNGCPQRDWRAVKAALTPEQVERIKEKCQWEGVSWLGVLRDWPGLFEATAPDERCRVCGGSYWEDAEAGGRCINCGTPHPNVETDDA